MAEATFPHARPAVVAGLNERLLQLVFCYLLLVLPLNYGLTSITIGGAPLHYGMLAIGLLAAAPWCLHGPSLLLLPVLMMLAVVFRLLLDGVGFWALRDASQVIDMQWIFVGWAVVVSGVARPLLRWWPWYLLAVALYWNTYPLRDLIEPIGPRAGLHGNGILGQYNSQIWAALILCTLVLLTDRIPLRWLYLIGGLCALFLLQVMSRIAIGGALMVGLYLLAIGRVRFMPFLIAFLIVLGAVLTVSVFNIQIDTRYGQLDGDMLWQAALSIIGEGDNVGAAAGVDQRLDWWLGGIEATLREPFGLFWGRGYGVVLTDHGVAGDVATRELHNSWVSAFCRLGLVGLGGLGLLYGGSALRVLGSCRGDWRHFCVMFIVFTGLVSFFEPGFENPQTSSLVWSIWGMLLAVAVSEERRWSAAPPRPTVKPNGVRERASQSFLLACLLPARLTARMSPMGSDITDDRPEIHPWHPAHRCYP